MFLPRLNRKQKSLIDGIGHLRQGIKHWYVIDQFLVLTYWLDGRKYQSVRKFEGIKHRRVWFSFMRTSAILMEADLMIKVREQVGPRALDLGIISSNYGDKSLYVTRSNK